MPDPRVVYIVAAVVVLALVVWVVVVLVQPAPAPRAGPEGEAPKPSTAPPPQVGRVSQGSTGAAGSLRPSRPPLNSHLEIQDEPAERRKADGES